MEIESRYWVATADGKVRHPVRNWYGDPEQSDRKMLICNEKPLWVHLCDEDEMTAKPVCGRCVAILTEERLMDDLMSEI